MTAELEAYDCEPRFEVERTEDGQDVVFSVFTDDVALRVKMGPSKTALSDLTATLRALADEADVILREWQDAPDQDNDSFVFDARKGYGANLAGKLIGDDYLSRDIACHHLARAMEKEGDYPNTWWEDERGGIDPFNEEMSAFFTKDGDKAVPLEGVQYQAGDRVLHEGEAWWVKQDYGQYGVVLTTDSAHPWSRRLVTDRNTITNLEDDDDEG